MSLASLSRSPSLTIIIIKNLVRIAMWKDLFLWVFVLFFRHCCYYNCWLRGKWICAAVYRGRKCTASPSCCLHNAGFLNISLLYFLMRYSSKIEGCDAYIEFFQNIKKIFQLNLTDFLDLNNSIKKLKICLNFISYCNFLILTTKP